MGAEDPRRRKMTAREAAERFGVTSRTIRYIVAEPRDKFEARAQQRQDEALALYEGGLSYQGVADAMDITRHAAAGLVRRARARLRNEASNDKDASAEAA